MLGFGLFVVTSLTGQPVPTPRDTTRQPTLAEHTRESFGGIGGIRELANGSVLVSDPVDRVIRVVGSDGKVRDKINAMQAPGALRPFGGDTTLAFDRGDNSFKFITPDAKIAKVPSSLGAPGGGPLIMNSSSDFYSADGGGRVFFTDIVRGGTTQTLRRRNQSGMVDSVAVLRSAGTIRVGDAGIQMTRQIPFSPVDAWAVGPNDDVFIARADPYRIDRLSLDGTIRSGAPHSYVPVPLTAADKAAAGQQQAPGGINIGGVSAPSAPTIPDSAWPKTKAPFRAGAIVVAPDGSSWVLRQLATDAPMAAVDVFDPSGTWREMILLPVGARIVGFGARNAFVAVHQPSGDRWRLMSFPWR